jgi:hypothetical protein
MNRITKSNSWIQSCSCKSFIYISQKTSQGREDGKARLSSWRIGQLLNPKLQWQKEFSTQDYCMHHWMTHIVINLGTYSPKNSDENMIQVTKNEAFAISRLWMYAALKTWSNLKGSQVDTSAGIPKSSACQWVSRVGLWFSLWSPPPLLVHFWKKKKLRFPAWVQIISIYFDEDLTHIQRALLSSKPSESVNVKLGALSN